MLSREYRHVHCWSLHYWDGTRRSRNSDSHFRRRDCSSKTPRFCSRTLLFMLGCWNSNCVGSLLQSEFIAYDALRFEKPNLPFLESIRGQYLGLENSKFDTDCA